MTTLVNPRPAPQRGIGRRTWIVWFLIGVVVALSVTYLRALTFGGDWTGLLSTWDDGPLRPIIEEQLGDVVTERAGGHDGQVTLW